MGELICMISAVVLIFIAVCIHLYVDAKEEQ